MAKVGRPPKYKTPEDMQSAIDAYFDCCREAKEPPTITGLALALDFDSREALLYYQSDKPEFLRTIKKAKSKVEVSLEKILLRGNNAAGVIFNLKNNFGWKDKTEQDINANVNVFGDFLDSLSKRHLPTGDDE